MTVHPYLLSAAGPGGLIVVTFEAVDDLHARSLAKMIVREQGANFLPHSMVEIIGPDATPLAERMSVAEMTVD